MILMNWDFRKVFFLLGNANENSLAIPKFAFTAIVIKNAVHIMVFKGNCAGETKKM